MATDIVSLETTASDDQWLLPEDRCNLVRQTNHEISLLAEGMIRLLRQTQDDDFPLYHGMLSRIRQLSEMQFFALRLHGDAGAEDEKEHGECARVSHLQRIYVGML